MAKPLEAAPTAEEIQRQRTSESIEVANQGIVAAQGGELSGAIVLMQKATRLDESNHYAWFLLGYFFDEQKNYDRAIEAYGEAARLGKDKEMYHYKLGKALWKASPKTNAARARAAIEHALHLNAKLFNAHLYLGQIYQQDNLPKKAARSWTTALSLSPSLGQATNYLAALYVQWRKYDQAKAVLSFGSNSVREPTELVTIHYTLAHVYELQGDWSEAIAVYSEALEIAPNDKDILRQRGFAYAEVGDTKAAILDFQGFLKNRGNAAPLEVQAVENRLVQLATKKSKPHTAKNPKTVLSAIAKIPDVLPDIPEFTVPAMVGGSHRVDELLFQGDLYLNTDIKIQGKIVWIYDCAKDIARPGMSKKKARQLIAEHPERCKRPHFNLADKRGANKNEHVEVVEVPRKIRPDERKALSRERIENWPTVPTQKVGQEVVVSGRWATQSPAGFLNSEGFLIYKSMDTRVLKPKR